ncbi:hypothetical protein [Streptomyces sp. FR-008]|uniref:hypothetical protein n=1 Tax=Streptomyces sp. FR-008 TaxID=206662 RepID=UPI00096AE2EB|nr:hypothetical protein [Streptomyces sp. FR-008]KAF0791637.1 hypothetical protein P405_20420 [Streptomyces sp. FR-008]
MRRNCGSPPRHTRTPVHRPCHPRDRAGQFTYTSCLRLDIEEADLLRRDDGLVELSFQKADSAWSTETDAKLGHSVEPEPDAAGASAGIHCHRVPGSGVRIFVRVREGARWQADAVWRLSVSPAWWREAE